VIVSLAIRGKLKHARRAFAATLDLRLDGASPAGAPVPVKLG
jgi:hypothetical protein